MYFFEKLQALMGLSEQMGAMGIPLLLTSLIALTLVLERLWVYLSFPSTGKKAITDLLKRMEISLTEGAEEPLKILLSEKKGLAYGFYLLLGHAKHSKELREEVGKLWLLEQRTYLGARLKLLLIIGIIAPMMGLLGTVLGLIEMFKSIAAVHEPVTPALLASGLYEAIYTTAIGLLVAIPALGAAHLLGLWSNRCLNRFSLALNRANLLISGVVPVSKKVKKTGLKVSQKAPLIELDPELPK